ncbi:hypothetical protein QVD17_16121 [Tagetes erecta]|uniref:ATPase AAA-type core domain-containing protein n=1 Tax=Tagetes erecta TaxID=13708 RepID=A0AAD8KX88_TARER|nr:hypothetical protein QVD17_16121 [Tagetes erecta]
MAKNLTGPETVAKNGCDKVPIEAKTTNGMTPLHSALERSRKSYVEKLLRHNASSSAKENESIIPLDHESEGSRNEKLKALVNTYLEEKQRKRTNAEEEHKRKHSHIEEEEEEQKKRRDTEADGETNAKMDEVEKELSNIVGLHELKLQIRNWAKGMLLHERRRGLGLNVQTRRLPHFVFLGNPGTGKTMIARILGKLLCLVGVLATNKVKEVQRTDLVGQYIGHTGVKTRNVVLARDFGLEALEEIMSVMDNGTTSVIFAGYPEPMKRVISSNEGFRRRVTKIFTFDDFSTEDLANILHLKMNSQTKDDPLYGFKLHPLCTMKTIADIIGSETTKDQRKEMNGGLVDHLLVNAIENLDSRLSLDCWDTEELLTITLEDLECGIKSFSIRENKVK